MSESLPELIPFNQQVHQVLSDARPATPEGKARSSANSRRHGLTASVLLDRESDEHFQLLLADFTDHFQPQTGVETDLVEVMAIARWRLRRLLAIETHLFDLEMSRREEEIDDQFDEMGQNDRLAFVFQHLTDTGNSLALLTRYEGSLNRSYDKALKHLLQLRSSRQNRTPKGPLGSFGIFEPDAVSNQESVTATGVEPGATPSMRGCDKEASENFAMATAIAITKLDPTRASSSAVSESLSRRQWQLWSDEARLQASRATLVEQLG